MRQWLDALEERHGLDTLTQRARLLVLGSFGLLVVLLAATGLVLQEGTQAAIVTSAIYILPLVLFTPSLVSGRARGHAWLAFVSLLYFMMGVNIAITPDLGWLGLVICLVALSMFVGTTGFARFRSRQLQVGRRG